jgi:IclR family pca regulon transcriptional regulator
MTKRRHDRDFVAALEKGLAIIEAFDAALPELTLTAAARKTGLTRAAARRYLLTLVSLGYAESDGKSFRLLPRILRLGYAYLSTASLPKLAQPILDRVGERVREVVSLATLDGTEVVFLARSESRRVISATTSVGMRLPAYCTAMGRVMLAGLTDAEAERRLSGAPLRLLTSRTRTDLRDVMAEISAARKNGFAVSDEELETGLRSIAVPVTNPQGKVMLAMSVSLQTAHMTVEEMVEKILPELNAAKSAISSML